jgi:hypothetical protein
MLTYTVTPGDEVNRDDSDAHRLMEQVFESIADSSNHLSENDFRNLFAVIGEVMDDEECADHFKLVDEDGDGKVCLKEFIDWCNDKRGSTENNSRSNVLREWLKNPLAEIILSNLKRDANMTINELVNAPLMDVDLRLKVGTIQRPEYGFDIVYSKKQTDQVEPPGIVFEASLQENVSFEEISPKLQRLAERIARELESESLPSIAPIASIASDGKPGVRICISFSAAHPILVASQIFLARIQEFRVACHLSQRIFEAVYPRSIVGDACFRFQGQRSFFELLSRDGNMSILPCMNCVHATFHFDQFGQIADKDIGRWLNSYTMADLKQQIALAVTSFVDGSDIFPIPLKDLLKVEINLGKHTFTFTGINLDISFALEGVQQLTNHRFPGQLDEQLLMRLLLSGSRNMFF